MSESSAEGKDESLDISVETTVENSPKLSKEVEGTESFAEGEDETGNTSLKMSVENCPEVIKKEEDKGPDFEEESEVKSLDHSLDTSKELSPTVGKSDEKEESPKVLTKAMESLSVADKSPPPHMSLRSKDRGSQSKLKGETPSKLRARARSIANVFESPYNTRLKAKMMKEKEQRSLSEDSGKRGAIQK